MSIWASATRIPSSTSILPARRASIGAVGPTPVDLLAQNYGAVFTNPQTTDNQLAMLAANGSVKLSDTWTASGTAYLRHYHQSRVDGNVSSVAPCKQLQAAANPAPPPPYDKKTSSACKPLAVLSSR